MGTSYFLKIQKYKIVTKAHTKHLYVRTHQNPPIIT